MDNLRTFSKYWENIWVKIITIIIIICVLWLIFYNNKTQTPPPILGRDDNGRIIIVSSDGKPIPVEECNQSGSNKCEIFRDQFTTEAIESITIVKSIATNNTRCCLTIIAYGIPVEICSDVPEDTTSCEDGAILEP